MERKLAFLIALFLTAFVSFARPAAADNKVEEIGAFADAGASDALKKALSPKGWRVSLAEGAYCDIWLCGAVPPGTTDQPGAVYTRLGESTLLGVITFAKATTDFRGQAVKPGSYTMRYELHPTDGNHMGISPIRDFLVMLPVSMDQNPEQRFKFEELTKMSTKVTSTSHPGVLSMVYIDSAPPMAKVETNEENHVVFSASLKMQSGAALPIAFVVKGRAEQ